MHILTQLSVHGIILKSNGLRPQNVGPAALLRQGLRPSCEPLRADGAGPAAPLKKKEGPEGPDPEDYPNLIGRSIRSQDRTNASLSVDSSFTRYSMPCLSKARRNKAASQSSSSA